MLGARRKSKSSFMANHQPIHLGLLECCYGSSRGRAGMRRDCVFYASWSSPVNVNPRPRCIYSPARKRERRKTRPSSPASGFGLARCDRARRSLPPCFGYPFPARRWRRWPFRFVVLLAPVTKALRQRRKTARSSFFSHLRERSFAGPKYFYYPSPLGGLGAGRRVAASHRRPRLWWSPRRHCCVVGEGRVLTYIFAGRTPIYPIWPNLPPGPSFSPSPPAWITATASTACDERTPSPGRRAHGGSVHHSHTASCSASSAPDAPAPRLAGAGRGACEVGSRRVGRARLWSATGVRPALGPRWTPPTR